MTEALRELCVCVIPGSFDMQFDLQVGVGTLVVAKPLDAEVQSAYNMTVQVTDGTNFATAQVHTLLISYALALLLTHSTPHQIKMLSPPPREAVYSLLSSFLHTRSLFF